jgi:SPP1 family phage portal protein
MIEDEDEELTKLIKRFKRYTAFNRVLGEVGKQAAIYGYGCMLAYVDKNGEFDFIEVEPYACYIADDLAARRVLPCYKEEEQKTVRFEVYDEKNVYILEGASEHTLEIIEEKPHMFDGIPLFKVKNNKEEINEFYRVRKLIDGLDKLYSDLSSEIEQFRLAYLKFMGTEPDKEAILQMVQTGAIVLPPDSDVDFITKAMAITEVLELIKKEEKNLFKFAMSYDPTDVEYAGQLTNLGIFFRMSLINNNCRNTIHYFTEGLYTLFEFYSQYLEKKGIKLDPYEVDFQFTLETPRNLEEEAQIQKTLDGIVSTETRMKLASFIENPTEEKKRLDDELSSVTSDDYSFGSDVYDREE